MGKGGTHLEVARNELLLKVMSPLVGADGSATRQRCSVEHVFWVVRVLEA